MVKSLSDTGMQRAVAAAGQASHQRSHNFLLGKEISYEDQMAGVPNTEESSGPEVAREMLISILTGNRNDLLSMIRTLNIAADFAVEVASALNTAGMDAVVPENLYNSSTQSVTEAKRMQNHLDEVIHMLMKMK